MGLGGRFSITLVNHRLRAAIVFKYIGDLHVHIIVESGKQHFRLVGELCLDDSYFLANQFGKVVLDILHDWSLSALAVIVGLVDVVTGVVSMVDFLLAIFFLGFG